MPSPYVEVVVPFCANGCPYRGAAWDFCRQRFEWSVRQVLGGEPWIKAVPAMAGVKASRAEIIVLADADVICEGLSAAVEAVQGGAEWAMPHAQVIRLSEEGTVAYIAGEPWEHFPVDRLPYRPIQGGGMLVARRETLLEIPMDPRFVGWGDEDWAHGFALWALRGDVWKGNHPLIHLWHPPEPRGEDDPRHGLGDNFALWQRYKKGRYDLNQMRELLKEASVALGAHQPSMHDHP